jgi:uncharacterized protein (DUF433 family)
MGIGSMIESTPGICGGRPRIAGTRIAVHRVAGYYRLGYSPEEILNALNSLNLQQVYAALAHSLANPDEIDAALRDEEQTASRLSASNRAA